MTKVEGGYRGHFRDDVVCERSLIGATSPPERGVRGVQLAVHAHGEAGEPVGGAARRAGRPGRGRGLPRACREDPRVAQDGRGAGGPHRTAAQGAPGLPR